MTSYLSRAFAYWLPFSIVFTGALGFSYWAVQQNYRQSVNDPQIQMAEDAATSLARDYTPANVVPHGTPLIDLSSSLATWTSIYDASGTSLESSGVLDGAPPQLPLGLFDASTWQPLKRWQAPTGIETRVTWQPRPGVRQAVTLVQFKTPNGVGYVAVGRSMRLVEERIAGLTHSAALAWGTTVLASFVAILLLLALGWL